MKIPMTVTQITRLTLLRVLRSLLFIIILAGALLLTPKLYAQSYDVTARVNSPLPTSPAIITSPTDQQHFNTPNITVSGTCGNGTYVAIIRNGAFAGTASCSGGFFTLQLTLTVGSNILQAKNYNNTDNEGSSSPPITVYYDIPLPQPVSVQKDISVGLKILSVEAQPFSPGLTFATSPRPIIQGLAPPYSNVLIQFDTDGPTCRVSADIHGKWTCQLAKDLADGAHQVSVSSVSPQGIVSKVPPFIIISSHATSSPAATPHEPLTLYFSYSYRTYKVNETWKGDISIQGGTPPYITSVDWNDGTSFQYKNSDSTTFSITHAFSKHGNYQPIVHVTDQHDDTASLQLLIPVVGENIRPNINPSIATIIIGIVGIVVLASIMTELGVAASSIFFKPPASKK